MFVLTVSFGLYHGLVLLPVLLSLAGPPGPGPGPGPARGHSNQVFATEEVAKPAALRQQWR